MAEILEGEFLELAGNFIALSIVRRVLERKGRKKPKSWVRKLLRKRKSALMPHFSLLSTQQLYFMNLFLKSLLNVLYRQSYFLISSRKARLSSLKAAIFLLVMFVQ